MHVNISLWLTLTCTLYLDVSVKLTCNIIFNKKFKYSNAIIAKNYIKTILNKAFIKLINK